MGLKKDKMTDEKQMVYTVEEVAVILKTNKNFVYRLIDKGVLPSIILGRRKVTRKALIKFLDEWDGADVNKAIKDVG